MVRQRNGDNAGVTLALSKLGVELGSTLKRNARHITISFRMFRYFDQSDSSKNVATKIELRNEIECFGFIIMV